MPGDVVPRIPLSSISKKEFDLKFRQTGHPVILTGILDTKTSWNLEYLEDQMNDQIFPVRWYGHKRYGIDKRLWNNIGSGVEVRMMPFKDYAALLRSGVAHQQDVYLAKCPIKDSPLNENSALRHLKNKLAELGLGKAEGAYNLWVGPAGHVEALHYDPLDGTLIQFYGSKRVLLFPPTATGGLYPFPTYVHLYKGLDMRSWFSQVYPEKPDYEAFPRLKKALDQGFELVLRPGELLFIPCGWWHEVTALGDDMVCSINRFWPVRPLRRSFFSWNVQRVRLGFLFALPHTSGKLIKALFSPDRRQEIKKVLHKV